MHKKTNSFDIQNKNFLIFLWNFYLRFCTVFQNYFTSSKQDPLRKLIN